VEAEAYQAPVGRAGFSVFVVSECTLQSPANAGAVAKAIISAAKTNKRFILVSLISSRYLRSNRLVGSPALPIFNTGSALGRCKLLLFCIVRCPFGPRSRHPELLRRKLTKFLMFRTQPLTSVSFDLALDLFHRPIACNWYGLITY